MANYSSPRKQMRKEILKELKQDPTVTSIFVGDDIIQVGRIPIEDIYKEPSALGLIKNPRAYYEYIEY